MSKGTLDPRPRLRELILSELVAERPRVLEAGCGAFDHLGLPDDWPITGLDVSPEAVELNDRIDEGIVADIQTVTLEPRFDLVVCWDVLEHLPDPGAALRNMAAALAPGGMLLLGLPLRSSFKGLATRLLPYRAHVLYYRHVIRWPHAGEPGHRPFPTPMRPEIEPDAITGILDGAGLEQLLGIKYATTHYGDILHSYGFASWVARLAAKTFGALSLGRVNPRVSDYVALHQRPVDGDGGGASALAGRDSEA